MKICTHLLVHLLTISLRGMVNVFGKHKKHTSVNGRTTACMERVTSLGQMASDTKVISLRINSMGMVSSCGRMELAIRGIGNKVRCTVLVKLPLPTIKKLKEHGLMVSLHYLQLKSMLKQLMLILKQLLEQLRIQLLNP